MSNTGENEQDLRKIADLTRLSSIFILMLHFYFYCYMAFNKWQLQSSITDKLLRNIAHTGLFSSPLISKLLALGLLVISMLGAQGTKDEKLSREKITILLFTGMLLFFYSGLLLKLHQSVETIAIVYMSLTGSGFLLMLAGFNHLTRLIKFKLSDDIFNAMNETFPQEERMLVNEYSINLPARYNLKAGIPLCPQ